MEDLHHIFEMGLLMVILAAGITAIAKKFKQPYPIVLVVVGAIIGLLDIPFLEPVKLLVTEEETFHFMVITLFLPALLGEAALKLPYSKLRDNKGPILSLAFGGTFLSFLVIGFSLYWIFDFSIPTSFVFAALMSATDPVSVLSIFKSVGVQKRLAIVVEGESLFNDGLAVVLFKISAFSLLMYIDMGVPGIGSGVFEFAKVVFLGVLIGGALGYGFSILVKYFDDYPLEIIFSILLFYGSFLLAENIHASGVIAVVVGAIIFGNYGASIGMSPTTKLNINNFWDVAALLANSLVFLMVGLEITRIQFSDKWGFIIVAVLLVLIARSIAVYTSLVFQKDFPTKWKHIINWGGLKGSLSIALVLSLPKDFPDRDLILILAFSVVFFSLIVQGLTIKPFIGMLGVRPKQKGNEEFEELLARLHRAEIGIEELNRIKRKLFITEVVYREFIQKYEEEIEHIQHALTNLFETSPELKEKQMKALERHTLYAESDAIRKLVQEEIISNETADRQQENIINELSKIES
ncbi:Na+/H+ antiporter [Bacillus carboniphilus]|uniref:Na+/H+ antiporter n=1 Tax=Bacillus carboniphilus TaxID=86663 RepID=A0ABP3GD58_9BACI